MNKEGEAATGSSLLFPHAEEYANAFLPTCGVFVSVKFVFATCVPRCHYKVFLLEVGDPLGAVPHGDMPQSVAHHTERAHLLFSANPLHIVTRFSLLN